MGGGVPAAEAGTSQLFAGGDHALLERCRPVLEALAGPGHIGHIGGNGAGYLAKLPSGVTGPWMVSSCL